MARNREAIDRKLAYTDVLTLLIQDEIARRDHRKLDARMWPGRIPRGWHGPRTSTRPPAAVRRGVALANNAL